MVTRYSERSAHQYHQKSVHHSIRFGLFDNFVCEYIHIPNTQIMNTQAIHQHRVLIFIPVTNSTIVSSTFMLHALFVVRTIIHQRSIIILHVHHKLKYEIDTSKWYVF